MEVRNNGLHLFPKTMLLRWNCLVPSVAMADILCGASAE